MTIIYYNYFAIELLQVEEPKSGSSSSASAAAAAQPNIGDVIARALVQRRGALDDRKADKVANDAEWD